MGILNSKLNWGERKKQTPERKPHLKIFMSAWCLFGPPTAKVHGKRDKQSEEVKTP